MDRATRLKRKYDQIYNATGDSNLARTYKFRGTKRIYEELGIKVDVNKTVSKKKQWTNHAKKHAERKREKFTMARELGFTVEDSKYLTQFRKDRLETTKEYRKVQKSGIASQKEKRELWTKWSGNKGKSMPADIVIKARDINHGVKKMASGRKLPHNANYGYGYIYWAWVLEKSPEEIAEGMQPNLLEPYLIYYPKEEMRPVR